MFERFEKIVGNIDNITNTKVMVIGIGGVGGYVVESLIRSGIKNIIIIDSDVVDVTNKNRQIIALDSTIGMKKVDVMKNRILDINKECNVEALDIFLDINNTDSIISKYKVDYVIDACDTITTKKEIIKSCIKNNIKLVSCMGTGNKLNPSKFKITDIRKTNYDPLAKILRKFIKDENIKEKVMVAWSDEQIKVDGRTPGSTSFVPSSVGLLITSYVVNDILNK